MFYLPETRFDFGGDEYIYAEISREMSIEINFKVQAITREIIRRRLPGVIEVCPANTGYLVQYKPEKVSPYKLLEIIREIDARYSDFSALTLPSRMIEIPIWYNDPITYEYAAKFRDRHQNPGGSNFEFVMKINGFTEPEPFIEAHTATPFLVTMMGFLPGTVWEYPLETRKDHVLQAPKYLSPRTDTPMRAVGIGGAFTVIYPTAGSGSYQLIGMSAIPVYAAEPQTVAMLGGRFLGKPGDIWKHRSITENEYHKILREVEEGSYRPTIREIEFKPADFLAHGSDYLQILLKEGGFA